MHQFNCEPPHPDHDAPADGSVGRPDYHSLALCACIPVALSLIALSVLLPRVMIGPLRHWDEAWYSQVSREILERDDWWTLHWNGAVWFHKPPLAFWATAGIFRAFGISEVAARLFSVLCAAATVGVLAGFVVRTLSVRSSLLAGSILLAIPEFCRYSSRGQLDAPLTLFVSCYLFSFWLALDQPRWHYAAGLSFGLALMTKGSAAFLAILVAAAYVLATRDWRCLRRREWRRSWLIALAIAAPWHAAQAHMHGSRFLHEYGGRHFTQFFADIYPEEDSHAAPASYYLEFLVRKCRPWGTVLIAVIALGFWQACRTGDRFLTLAACWSAAIPIGLSFARTKWSWYLVPMYPGGALLATLLMSRSAFWHDRSRVVLTAAAIAVAIVAAEPAWTLPSREYESHLRSLAPLVQAHVPPGTPIHTLQAGRATTSIYPIATRFYCDRPVHVTHEVTALAALGRNASSVFHVLVHESHVAAIESSGQKFGDPGWYAVEEAGRNGPVVLLRIIPGHIAAAFEKYR